MLRLLKQGRKIKMVIISHKEATARLLARPTDKGSMGIHDTSDPEERVLVRTSDEEQGKEISRIARKTNTGGDDFSVVIPEEGDMPKALSF